MILALLVLWPVAELAAAIAVADAVGVLVCVILLLASWPLGTWLVRAEGRTARRRLRAAIAAGRSPGGEVVDGALVMLGGPLLIVPGFISDVLGLALLVPGVRRALRRVVARHARGRLLARLAGRGRRPPMPYDVDATARSGARRSRLTNRPRLHG